MLDLYRFIEKNPLFHQFNVDELLFTAYDCQIEEEKLDYWVEKNYFCYIVRGEVKWTTLHDDHFLQVGDAAFLRKGAHRIAKIAKGDFCALLIFMPDEFIKSVISEDLSNRFKHSLEGLTESIIPLTVDQTLLDYFQTLLRYFSQSTPPAKSLLKIKFKELIINIVTGRHNPKLAQYFLEIFLRNKRALKPTMEENFRFNLKLEDFAKLSGRSLSTFNRDFLKEYGISPGKWLRSRRVQYGKFLLATKGLSINEVAYEAGFQNTSHFIKVFKSYYQCTPMTFRKSINAPGQVSA